jgi:hypothetical protein
LPLSKFYKNLSKSSSSLSISSLLTSSIEFFILSFSSISS